MTAVLDAPDEVLVSDLAPGLPVTMPDEVRALLVLLGLDGVALQIGSLFSGYGGLDMAARALFGGRVVFHSEIEGAPNDRRDHPVAACAVLAHHHPDVENLGDITRIDWDDVLRRLGTIHILTGGFPCQDLSHAGKQAGLEEGTRSGLWLHFVRAIQALRPPIVLVENVRGLLTARAGRSADAEDIEGDPFYDYIEEIDGGEDPDGDDGWDVLGSEDGDLGEQDGTGPVLLRALGAVCGTLADIGYDAAWIAVPASDVGAPHRRLRVFLLAWLAADAEDAHRRWRGLGLPTQGEGSRRPEPRGRGAAGAAGGHEPAADTSGDGRDEGRPEPAGLVGGPDAAVRGDALPDTDDAGRREHGRGVAVRPEHAAAERDGDDAAPDAGGERHGRGEDRRGLGRLDGPAAGGTRQRERAREVTRDRVAAAAPDAPVGGEPNVEVGGDEAGLDVGTEPRAGDGDRGGPAPEGVHVVGRAAGVVAACPRCGDPVEHHDEGGFCAGSCGGTCTDPEFGRADDAAAPDAGGEGRGRREEQHLDEAGGVDGQAGGHPDGLGVEARRVEWGPYEPAIRRWKHVLNRDAPSPTEPGAKGQPRLAPTFVEWMMGLPAGHVTDVPNTTRNQQLKLLGNGVVPQQAAAAYHYLAGRLVVALLTEEVAA